MLSVLRRDVLRVPAIRAFERRSVELAGGCRQTHRRSRFCSISVVGIDGCRAPLSAVFSLYGAGANGTTGISRVAGGVGGEDWRWGGPGKREGVLAAKICNALEGAFLLAAWKQSLFQVLVLVLRGWMCAYEYFQLMARAACR